MRRAELEQLRSVALAHINRSPGICQDRLAVALGMSAYLSNQSGKCRMRRNRTVIRLLQIMVDAGEIWIAKDQFATDSDPLKCYPAGYIKPKKKLFQCSDRASTECKVYFDPSVVGSPQPTQKCIDYIPTTVQWKSSKPSQQEEPMKRNAQAIEDSVKEAIAHFQRLGKPFSQSAIIDRAKINYGMLAARSELLNLVKSAVAASQPKDAIEAHLQRHAATAKPEAMPVEATEPVNNRSEERSDEAESPHFTTAPKAQALIQMVKQVTPEEVKAAIAPHVQELEAKVADLEQRNRELRQQLAAAQPAYDGYLEGLKADEQHWRDTLQRIDEDMRQLEQDRASVISNLYAVQRLLATKTGEQPAIEFEIVVSTNGNGSTHAHHAA